MGKLFSQIIKFGVVGVIAFIIDYVVLVVCTEVFRVYYLVSSLLSFSVSTIFNFIASSSWVFESCRKGKFLVFVVLSVVGLGFNQVFMYVGVDLLGVYYMVAKVVSTGIVMVYNFVSRKLFLYRN